MASDERSGVLARLVGSARGWAPYLALAALVLVGSAVAGALAGPGSSSPFVPQPAGAGDATGSVLYVLSVAAVMIVGGVFVGLPTVALLGLQGQQFGRALAALAGQGGWSGAVATAAPAAVLALPALVVVAAIPFRGLHYASRMIREGKTPTVPTRRLVAESVLLAVLALLALSLAAVLAAGAA